MHFDECLSLDRKKLIDNKKEFKIKNAHGEIETVTYCEYKIRELMPQFRKNNLCFDLLKDKVIKAKANSLKFENHLIELKSKVGTNLVFLFDEIETNSNI